MVIEAKYENGVFKPLGKLKLKLKEGTLVEIHVDREEPRRSAQSIRKLGFAEMWAHRADIKNGVSYGNRLRDKARRFTPTLD
jgi:predicted DNA-binding antitoxin AbrB/MazE fold protein